MYLLNVSYTKLPEEIAQYQDAHRLWVKKNIEEENFLLAGPKKSKLGGVILVKSMDKKKLSEILAEDSFVQHDVAEYQITDFDCKLAHEAMQAITGA